MTDYVMITKIDSTGNGTKTLQYFVDISRHKDGMPNFNKFSRLQMIRISSFVVEDGELVKCRGDIGKLLYDVLIREKLPKIRLTLPENIRRCIVTDEDNL